MVHRSYCSLLKNCLFILYDDITIRNFQNSIIIVIIVIIIVGLRGLQHIGASSYRFGGRCLCEVRTSLHLGPVQFLLAFVTVLRLAWFMTEPKRSYNGRPRCRRILIGAHLQASKSCKSLSRLQHPLQGLGFKTQSWICPGMGGPRKRGPCMLQISRTSP